MKVFLIIVVQVIAISSILGQIRTTDVAPTFEEITDPSISVFMSDDAQYTIAKANLNEAKGHFYFENSNYSDAIKFFEKALIDHEFTILNCEEECDELLAFIYFRLAICYSKLNRDAESISIFTKSIEFLENASNTSFVIRYISNLEDST
ncbi:hypothetical protein C9994_16450, partial [Marivirga lumbricoides]